MQHFVCAYCGTEVVVERRGGTITLKPLTDAIHKVQIGTDKTAAELAIRRLLDEREEIVGKSQEYQEQAQAKLRNMYAAMKLHEINVKYLGQLALVSFCILCIFLFLIGSIQKSEQGSAVTCLLLLLAIGAVVGIVVWSVTAKKKKAQQFKQEIASAEANQQADIANFDQQIQDLTRRIAEKKAIADS
jgi:thiol:disulfide interchange protein